MKSAVTWCTDSGTSSDEPAGLSDYDRGSRVTENICDAFREKSYSERLFLYKEIGSLSKEQSEAAIRVPAEKFDVHYTDEAIDRIVEITKGYPFLFSSFVRLFIRIQIANQLM